MLYILGLKIQEKNGTILIVPDEKTQNTLYHAIISKLKSHDKFTKNSETNTENAMSLIIPWLNRILFLKLVEANLLRFNKNQNLKFLTSQKVVNFAALNEIFFEVFAKTFAQRKDSGMDTTSHLFALPYLNSSLFEKTKQEREFFEINAISNNPLLDYKDKAKKAPLLNYLLDFLNRYDFSSGDENATSETIINASILGKIFEKLNGYKDGAVFTKSFITSYMCKQSIEQIVLEKFAQLGLNATNLDELKGLILMNANADFAFKAKAKNALL